MTITDETLQATAHGPVRYDTTDFGALTPEEQVAFFEINGYIVLPDLLTQLEMATVVTELEDLPMTMATTGSRIRFSKEHPPQFHSPTFARLTTTPKLLDFLELVMGPDIIFMLGHYLSAGGGGDVGPGLALHSDYQPFGSPEKGWEESSPATLRVLVNVLGKEPVSDSDGRPVPQGITFVPRSHTSLHTFADPYVKYDNHPDMVTVPTQQGDATIFNVKVFHGGHPGAPRPVDSVPNNTLEYAFRPGWAPCAREVPEWSAAQLATIPEVAQRFFTRGRNASAFDRPTGRVDAQGAARIMR